MKIKERHGAAEDVEALQALGRRADVDPKTKEKIELEIRKVRAGEQGEREASYEIDFHHAPSRNWAVLHDLRIEHDGRVAQIDHLLISRFLDIWVCETKHFGQGVAINERGEFTSFFQGRPQAIASPVEQNRKHLLVLDAILHSDKVTLPTRLGMRLEPRLRSVVLVSQNARITWPKTGIDGLDSIVKSDQLRTLIDRKIDEESAVSALMTVGKLLSSEALEDFARQVARLHRPSRTDWHARFGLSARQAPPTTASSVAPVGPCDAPSLRSTARDLEAVAPESASMLERISTSKLGSSMGLANVAATLERLRTAGYLEEVDGSDRLTDKGSAIGGRFVEKSRFGPYFVWPKNLRC